MAANCPTIKSEMHIYAPCLIVVFLIVPTRAYLVANTGGFRDGRTRAEPHIGVARQIAFLEADSGSPGDISQG